MVKTTYFEEYRDWRVSPDLGSDDYRERYRHPCRTNRGLFPHHVDAEWSKTNEFGQRIAHGTLILSIGAGMTATEINPVSIFS